MTDSVFMTPITSRPAAATDEGLGDRVRVGELADEDDVGVLAGDATQGVDDVRGVGADLALADDRRRGRRGGPRSGPRWSRCGATARR